MTRSLPNPFVGNSGLATLFATPIAQTTYPKLALVLDAVDDIYLESLRGAVFYFDESCPALPTAFVAQLEARGGKIIPHLNIPHPANVIVVSNSHPNISHFTSHNPNLHLHMNDLTNFIDTCDAQSIIISERGMGLPDHLPLSDDSMMAYRVGKSDGEATKYTLDRMREGSTYLRGKRWMKDMRELLGTRVEQADLGIEFDISFEEDVEMGDELMDSLATVSITLPTSSPTMLDRKPLASLWSTPVSPPAHLAISIPMLGSYTSTYAPFIYAGTSTSVKPHPKPSPKSGRRKRSHATPSSTSSLTRIKLGYPKPVPYAPVRRFTLDPSFRITEQEGYDADDDKRGVRLVTASPVLDHLPAPFNPRTPPVQPELLAPPSPARKSKLRKARAGSEGREVKAEEAGARWAKTMREDAKMKMKGKGRA